MKNFDKIGEDLFNKIRGRFPGVTIGDEEGNITNEPEQARFFDFDYRSGERKLGKVSVSISEDNGLTVIFSRDFIKNEDELTQKAWYNFLKEMRRFSKKRLMNFDVRDITKTNLTKRDYKFLAANRPGDETMNESKLYGTGRVSYQNIDSSRIVIKHNESIDQENPAARTRNINSIYIESAEGERFKYPYRHLSGARAMARHVAEGGKPYDDFGSHITELSEEMWKLRKFKNYVGRSAVMAESLEGYMDIVKERVTTIKKTIESFQKPNRYHEAINSFEKPVFEDVPDDVKENWIDELTIRQFNEELKDVFPYIYRLVGEGTRAKALGPDELISETSDEGKYQIVRKTDGKVLDTFKNEKLANQHYHVKKGWAEVKSNENEDLVSEDDDPCWKNYKQVGMKEKGGKKVPNCVPKEEIELEQGFEEMMGQFSEATVEHGRLYVKFRAKKTPGAGPQGAQEYLTGFADFAQDPDQVKEKTALRKFTALNNMKDIANAIKKLMKDKVFVSAKKIILYRDSAGLENKFSQLEEFYDWIEGYQGDKIAIEEPEDDPDKPEREKGVGKKRKPKGYYAANPKDYEIPDKKMTRYFSIDNDRLLTFLRKQMPDFMNKHYKANMGMFMMNDKDYQQFRKFLRSPKIVDNYGTTSLQVDQERSFAEDNEEKEQKTPISEFILSYFDYTSGQFPKGETAVLTMVEKDYGEEFIEPAKAFIERINERVSEVMGYKEEPDIQEISDRGDDRLTKEYNYPDDMDQSYLDGDDSIEDAFDEAKQEILYNIKNYDEEILRDLANPNYYDPEQVDDEISDLSSEVVDSFVRGRYDNNVADEISSELYSYAKQLLYKKFQSVSKQENREEPDIQEDDIEFDRVRKLAGL